ncbi:MAG: exo-alpha-sialidase [Planctomycetota bacterium]
MSEQLELFVATRKGLFEYRQAGDSWELIGRHFLGVPVLIVFPDPRDGTTYAALNHGHFGTKIHRRMAGQEWEELECPAYPEKPEGLVDEDPFRKEPTPWAVQKIWALEGGGPDHPNRLWCGTIPGGLFLSEDKGNSWELVRSLWDEPARAEWFGGGEDWPGIHSICVDPRDSNCIRVGVSCGGVWESLDAGATWTCRADGMRAAYMPPDQANNPHTQDPHLMVQCPSSPDTFWAQHHNGIFRSTDACRSWSEVEPAVSGFGFAVSVHPEDGDRAWFVPGIKDELRIPVDGKLVVTHTTDGGQSFDVQRNGLPQEDAYDIVYRHAMDIGPAGNRLAFGSTTGNLWTTSDGGQQWELVATHLPPVYAVRYLAR